MRNSQNQKAERANPGWWRNPRNWRLAILGGLTVAAAAILPSQTLAQINILANPGAETDSYSGWNVYNNAGYNMNVVTNNPTTGLTPYDGTYCFFVYGDYNFATEYNGFYQTIFAHSGQVFTAGGWGFTLGSDYVGQAGNNAFVEVTFQDASNNTLARYRSVSMETGFPTNAWISLDVTNQYDPVTYAFLGTVSNLVAPANTAAVEYNFAFNLVNYGGGSVYLDDLALTSFAPPPPYITNVTPAGVILSTATNLSFAAVAQSGTITNIQVVVQAVTNGLPGYPAGATSVTTTNGANLTVTGLGTAGATASYALSPNLIYTFNLQVTDSNGGGAATSTTLDTLRPALVWEAEDFNYDSGQYTNTTPDGGTSVLPNVVGTEGIDEHKAGGFQGNQPHYYRATDPVSVQPAYEINGNREKFAAGIASGDVNLIDQEVGYVQPGDWLDWTRTIPSGNYNVYARLATSGGGTQLNFGKVTSDPTAGNQILTNLGTFTFTDNNWNQYDYVPLEDQYGNLVSVPLNGITTFRSTVVGNPNQNFYMLVPAVGSVNPVLTSVFPDGTQPFQATNVFSFTVGPANGSALTAGGVHLSLNGVDVTSQLTVTPGAGGSLTATIPIAANSQYSAVMTVTNSTSLGSKYTVSFDTFSENNFMFEAEDFDFNGGQFIDNPVPTGNSDLTGTGASGSVRGTLATNSYWGYPAGDPNNASVFGVDFTTDGSADTSDLYYRPFDNCGTELNYDYQRKKFLAARTAIGDPDICDFDVGWWNAGWWLNYTRTFPAGNYNIYGRLAGGAGAFSGTTISIVTNGWGTANQSSNLLGSFADPNAVGWQTWHWVPLLDTNNAMVVVPLGGVQTLKLTSGNNLNANYYMLVPVAPPLSVSGAVSGSTFNLSFPTSAGFTYTVYYSTGLGGAWQTLTSISGDGASHTVTDAVAGAQRFYRVGVH